MSLWSQLAFFRSHIGLTGLQYKKHTVYPKWNEHPKEGFISELFSPNGELEMRTVYPCPSLHRVCSIEMYCNELIPPSLHFR